MQWTFTLIRERDNVTLITDDPTGWDSAKLTLARDTTRHGIAFDFSVGALQFLNEAATFIKNEYDDYGTEAKMLLVVEQDCDGTMTELIRGSLDFGQYRYFSGVRCYVEVALEATSDVMTLNNRSDQKVNLENLVSFDGVTLPAYTALGQILTLKAKGIPVADHAVVETGTTATEQFTGGLQMPYNTTAPIGVETNLNYNQINLAFNKTVASEIGNFYVSTPILDQIFNGGNDGNFGTTFQHHVPGELNPAGQPVYPLGSSPIINYTEDSPSFNQLAATSRLRIHFRGTIQNPRTYLLVNMAFIIGILPRSTRSDFGTKDSDYRWIYGDMMGNAVDPNDFTAPGATVNISGDVDMNITLDPGDRVYAFITVANRTSQAQIDEIEADSANYAFNVTFTDESYFLLENLSNGGLNTQTPVKSFMVNEALARVVEAITNNKLTAYSDYFGRTNAQPYPSAALGCGAMEILTNGLFIRAVEQTRENTPPVFAVSLDDLWEGLNPIHNIGFGIEDDPNRAGQKLLRVERWEYFYNPAVIFTCAMVEILNETAAPERCYSVYKFGYNKWEARAFTGLDEFLTKREYRTTLTGVKNTLNTLSAFVASGYAIEITRRLGNDTSQDSTYDNDTFIICVHNDVDENPIPNVYTGIITRYTDHADIDAPDFATYALTLPANASFRIENPILNSFAIVTDWEVYYMFGNPQGIRTTNATVMFWGSTGGTFYDTLNVYTRIPALLAEQGGITSPANMVDPDTILNFRISPNRNAIRWANTVFQSYRNAADREILFSDGEGNFYAEGQLTDSCAVEAGVLKENQTINAAIIKDPAYETPLISYETITFDYPISAKDFGFLKQNRLGLIAYTTPQGSGQGWLLNLQLTPAQGGGVATFTLIKKYGS